MFMKKIILSAIVLSLAACGSTSGNKPAIEATPAIEAVPEQYREKVTQTKFADDTPENLQKEMEKWVSKTLHIVDTELDKLDKVVLKVDGQVIPRAEWGGWERKTLENKPEGFSGYKTELYLDDDQENNQIVFNDVVYNQVYSVVVGSLVEQYKIDGADQDDVGTFFIDTVKSVAVGENFKIPDSGKATFKGKAFDKDTVSDRAKSGDLTYTIDFDAKKGQGGITGLTVGEIELKEADLSDRVILGEASISGEKGDYELYLGGLDEVSEIAGKVYQDDTNGVSKDIAGFAGVKEK